MMSANNIEDPDSKSFHQFSTKDPDEFDRYLLRKQSENRQNQDELEQEATAELLQNSEILSKLR